MVVDLKIGFACANDESLSLNRAGKGSYARRSSRRQHANHREAKLWSRLTRRTWTCSAIRSPSNKVQENRFPTDVHIRMV
jgi:hypothetical protein